MSERSERMLSMVPDYYQQSLVFEKIQTAIADDYDLLEVADQDLNDQFYILKATWGLKYWEAALGILVVLSDAYDIRRSRVLSGWRSLASQFSAALIERVCEAFTNGDVSVSMDIPNGVVKIQFIGALGVPPNIDDLKAQIDNIIHAHLGTEYQYRYITYDQLTAMTYNEVMVTIYNKFAPFA